MELTEACIPSERALGVTSGALFGDEEWVVTKNRLDLGVLL